MLFDKYNDLRRISFMQMDSKILDHEGILKYKQTLHTSEMAKKHINIKNI